MIVIGKGKVERAGYKATLQSAHRLLIRVQLLDLDMNYKQDLSNNFLGGQVSVDADADITRALDLALIDPTGRVSIEPDDPSHTSVFIADMIKIVYVIYNPMTQKTYEVPLFCGPVDSVNRNGMFIDVKCVGKESLGLNNVWNAKTFKKGQAKTTVIKAILREIMGETRMDIPNKGAKLPHDLKLNDEDLPWKVATQLAGSMGYQLFYDGRGTAVMRKRKGRPSLRLDKTWLSEPPAVSYDMSTTINAVKVVGGKPKKSKHTVGARIVADRKHPLSPWRVGRGGVPRYIWESIEDDSLRTVKECTALGKTRLSIGLKSGIQFAATGLPEPRLEELDMVMLVCDDVIVQAPIHKFVIPLTAGDEATYGYLKRITPKGGASMIKRHKNKNKGKHNHRGKNHHKKHSDGKGRKH